MILRLFLFFFRRNKDKDIKAWFLVFSKKLKYGSPGGRIEKNWTQKKLYIPLNIPSKSFLYFRRKRFILFLQICTP